MSVSHILLYRPALTVPIICIEEDFHGVDVNQDGPMVVRVIIANFKVRRVLIDQGSSVDILFIDAFNKLDLSEEHICPFHNTLFRFTGEQVQVKGNIELLTTFTGVRSFLIKFLIVERGNPYSAILGRPLLII